MDKRVGQGVFLMGLACLVGAFSVLSCGGGGGGGGGAAAAPQPQDPPPVFQRHDYYKSDFTIPRNATGIWWFVEVFFNPDPYEHILQVWVDGQATFTGSHNGRIELMNSDYGKYLTFLLGEQDFSIYKFGGWYGFRMALMAPFSGKGIVVTDMTNANQMPPPEYPATQYILRAGFSNTSQVYDLRVKDIKVRILTTKDVKILDQSSKIQHVTWP